MAPSNKACGKKRAEKKSGKKAFRIMAYSLKICNNDKGFKFLLITRTPSYRTPFLKRIFVEAPIKQFNYEIRSVFLLGFMQQFLCTFLIVC